MPLFYAPKNIVLKQALICPGHYGNDLAASVFFNVCIAEHVSEAERCDAQLDIPLCRRALRSIQSLPAKANGPLMFCSPVNQIPLGSHSDIHLFSYL